MKKYLLRIFAVLLLFIPTYLSVYFYLSAKDDPVNENSVYAVDFLDTRGDMTHYEASDPEWSNLIDLLMTIHDSAKNTESLPADLVGTPCITVTYYSYDMKTDYRYYFSAGKPSNSYYQDSDGNAYRIDATDAIKFLDSDFSLCLYDGSIIPVLTVLGMEMPADTLNWSYYSYSNLEHKVSLAEEDDNHPKLESSYRSFEMSFDKLPDEATVSLTDSKGSPVFEGSLSEFQESAVIRNSVRSDTDLTFRIVASWKQGYGNGSSGSADYLFTVHFLFDPAADFWLGEDSVEAGEFVVISGEYIEDPQAISVTATPALSASPLFFVDGDKIRGILPIDQNIVAETEFVIRIQYHTIQKELKLTVLPSSAATKVRKYNYSNLIDLSTRSQKNLDKFTELIAGLPYEQQIYFSGAFRKPDENQNRARFGDTVNNGTSEDQFISNGIAWVSYKGEAIYAANSGKVIYVGETAMGGLTLVIDHGLGLRSVYYCLGEVKVSVGDRVNSDTLVATGGGKSGYTDGHTCYLELWVGSTPVAYYSIVEGGRTGEIVFGEPS